MHNEHEQIIKEVMALQGVVQEALDKIVSAVEGIGASMPDKASVDKVPPGATPAGSGEFVAPAMPFRYRLDLKPDNGCILAANARNAAPLSANRRRQVARALWMRSHGAIGDYEFRSFCDTADCVNPEHHARVRKEDARDFSAFVSGLSMLKHIDIDDESFIEDLYRRAPEPDEDGHIVPVGPNAEPYSMPGGRKISLPRLIAFVEDDELAEAMVPFKMQRTCKKVGCIAREHHRVTMMDPDTLDRCKVS